MRYFALFFGLLLILISLWPLSKAREFQIFGDVIARIATTERVVALTLDDGPSRRYTADVLTILADRNVRATFFLTGQEATKNPDLLTAIVAEGHEVGNHSFSHSRMIARSPSWVRREIDRTDAAFRAVGYDGPISFRPPYGQKLFSLPWVLAADDRPTIMWDVMSGPEDMTPQAMADDIIAQTENGSIILMHVMYQSRATSRAALPLVIDGLRERGFVFVTLADLLASS